MHGVKPQASRPGLFETEENRMSLSTPAEQYADTAGVTGRDAPPLWRQLATARWGDGPVGVVAAYTVLLIAIGLGCFQLYTAISLDLDAFLQRVFRLGIVFQDTARGQIQELVEATYQ
jgi:hypothetical protein